MGIIKNYHDKKWTLQFLDALYNSIDNDKELLVYLCDNNVFGLIKDKTLYDNSLV
jgi:hypothetical protein